MTDYEVLETEKFKTDLEDAAFWLYLHNLEQSESFADQKFKELESEINSLKSHLRKTPRMGQTHEDSEIRRFPVYDGRYWVNWIINDHSRTVTFA